MKPLLIAFVLLGLDGKPDVHQLVKDLESDDGEVRIKAAQNLNSLGKKANAAVGSLVQAYTRESDRSVYLELEQALKKNGQASANAIMDYASNAKNNPSKRVLLLGLLLDREYNQYAASINRRLLPLFRDADKDVAVRSAIIVLSENASNQEALAVLVKAVNEEKPNTPVEDRIADWYRALYALAKSRHGEIAVPHLVSHLKKSIRNPPERITEFELYVLQKVTYHLWLAGKGSNAALPVVTDLFEKYQGNSELRGDVGLFLGSFILHHQNQNDRVRRYMSASLLDIRRQLSGDYSLMLIGALESLGSDAASALADLEIIAKEGEPSRKAAAKKAITRIKKKDN